MYSPRVFCVDVALCGFHPRAKAIEFEHETSRFQSRIVANRRMSDEKAAELPTAGNRESGRVSDRSWPARWNADPPMCKPVDSRHLCLQTRGFLTPDEFPQNFPSATYMRAAIPAAMAEEGKWKTDSRN